MNKIECVFCDQDMSKEKYREDYTLLAWKDDPEDPTSFNKVAKPAHFRCYVRFAELNKLAL